LQTWIEPCKAGLKLRVAKIDNHQCCSGRWAVLGISKSTTVLLRFFNATLFMLVRRSVSEAVVAWNLERTLMYIPHAENPYVPKNRLDTLNPDRTCLSSRG
jgi:hypothetical protein